MHNTSTKSAARLAARATAAGVFILTASGCGDASAQVKPADAQIAEAVRAAPETMREGAGVLGYAESGEIAILREGSNSLLCLADDPTDERFEVACYHRDLEPFMARGRDLVTQGMTGAERQQTRWAEIEAGELAMPRTPSALYVLAANSAEEEGQTRMVIYVPFATAEELGLPVSPGDGRPWLMMPGRPSAHIMISQ